LQILGYVALAMLLGGVLGLDREIAHKPAGLRTHMMVAGVSALREYSSAIDRPKPWRGLPPLPHSRLSPESG
jgi:MgtC family